MIKYILTGGRDRAPENLEYAGLLADELKKQYSSLNILSCLFAWSDAQQQERFEAWDKWFRNKLGNISSHKLATKENFVEEVKASDIIYLHAGDNKMMKEAMFEFTNLKEVFEGKTIIASSAGANLISNNFWSSTKDRAFKGRAILDIDIMAHYGASRKDIGKDLDDSYWSESAKVFQKIIGKNRSIIKLPEGKIFIVEDK